MPTNVPNVAASMSVNVSSAGSSAAAAGPNGGSWPPGAFKMDAPEGADPRKVRMPRFEAAMPLNWGTTNLASQGYTNNLSRSGLAITVRDGRYGPYVNWGKVNATLPKGKDPASVTLEDALALIAEKGGSAKKPARRAAPAKAAAKKSAKAAPKAAPAAKRKAAPARRAKPGGVDFEPGHCSL